MSQLQHLVDGPAAAPVLVLGPSLGTDAGLFDRQVAALADRWRIVRYDLPGHGGAPLPPGPCTVASLADEVAALLRGLGVERFHYAGVSLGGAIGLALAISHPGRLLSLTVCASAARFPDPDSWRARASIVRDEGTGAVVESRTGTWFTPRLAAERPDEADRLLTMLRATSAEGYARCCEAVADFDVRADLGRIAVATLVIAGADDPATPVGTVREVADGIPGSSFVVVPDAAHLVNAEQPVPVNEALADHLRAQRPGRA